MNGTAAAIAIAEAAREGWCGQQRGPVAHRAGGWLGRQQTPAMSSGHCWQGNLEMRSARGSGLLTGLGGGVAGAMNVARLQPFLAFDQLVLDLFAVLQ